METVGQRLKRLRGKLSIIELSNKLHLNNSSIVSKWERGERNPKDSALQAYANYFNVPIDWIRYGDFDEFCNKVLTYAIETDIPNPLYMELKRLLDITAQRYAINEEPKEDAQTRIETLKRFYGDSLINMIKEKGAVYDEGSILQIAINIIADTLNGGGAELFASTIKNLKAVQSITQKIINDGKSGDDLEELKQVDNDITALLSSLDKLLNQ